MSSSGARILVVDPDRTTLEMVQIRLDVAGHHVLTARTGRAALEQVLGNRVDAVVLERNLPDVDGLEFLRELSTLPGRVIPVLLVGKALAAEDVHRAIAYGVCDVLAKPFSGAVVLDRIGRMLKKGAQNALAGRVVAIG